MAQVGRPSGFTQAIADEICEWLMEGKSLRAYCAQPGKPTRAMILRWLAKNEEFRVQYAVARDEQADIYADEIIDIADNASPEEAQVARLQIDSRKWIASKLLPKKYGDMNRTEITGADGGTIKFETVNRLELARWIAAQLTAAVDEPKLIDAS